MNLLHLYFLFLFLSFSLCPPVHDNYMYEEPEQYEELLQPQEFEEVKTKIPHHPGFNSNSKSHSTNRRIPNPMGPNHYRPHHPGGIPIDREMAYHESPMGHQGPMHMGGNGPRRSRIPPSQTYHSSTGPQHQNIEYNNNNSNKWYSGPFGTLYEIMMIFFLIGLVYNCIFGRNQNDKHALAWYNANKQYFEERYEHIGLDKSDMEDFPVDNMMKDSVLIKESPYFYKFYCSNYRYIRWLLTALEFRKRFDATSMLTSLFMSDRDKLVYEVAFNPVDPLGWVFCVCKKREASAIKNTYEDINYFTSLYEPSVMNEQMCLLSENQEVFMELFNNKNLFPYYKQIEQYLDIIYFTDQSSFCKEPFAVFFAFNINLTYSGQDRKLLEITHFVNLFVDTLAQLKYSVKFKNEVKNNRITLERTKMEEGKRKEIEEKEKRDFIEKWKIKNKLKTKKGAERRKLMKELQKYE